MGEAESRPKREARPPSVYQYDDGDEDDDDDGWSRPPFMRPRIFRVLESASRLPSTPMLFRHELLILISIRVPAAPEGPGDTGSGPRAIAAYDFEAENPGELSFREQQIIKLISRLDENWLEGEVDGKVGIFPSNYVEVLEDV